MSRNVELEEFKVVEKFELRENTSESIYLTSKEPRRYIKFYKYDLQKDKNEELIEALSIEKSTSNKKTGI